MITIEQLEKEFGLPIKKWAGKCYQVACAAAKLIKGAEPIYGHFLGEVKEGTMFHTSALAGFVQHGWVQLPDGQILDPTRWVFEGAKPYLYHGPNDCYDEGGNALRMALMGGPPEFDPDEDIINIKPHMLATKAWVFVEERLGLEDALMYEGYEPGDITKEQLFWLANQDPRKLHGHARAIYAMLEGLDMKGFVPIDNWGMVERSPM